MKEHTRHDTQEHAAGAIQEHVRRSHIGAYEQEQQLLLLRAVQEVSKNPSI